MAPTITELQAQSDNRAFVRKISKAVGLLAPTSVDLPESLIASGGGIVDLQEEGYVPLGMITPDGYRFGRDMEKEDVEALGHASYVRSDITRVARTIAFNAMEVHRKALQELIYGQDLSGVTVGADGEIVWDEADLPDGREYRLVVIAGDGPADAHWTMGLGFPSVKLAEVGEEEWSREGALQREITLDVFTDEDLGTPVRHYLGGTAVAKHSEALGFAETS